MQRPPPGPSHRIQVDGRDEHPLPLIQARTVKKQDKIRVVFEGGFGVRNLGERKTVNADTLFMIASNTKALTTLLLAKLVAERRLTWNTPVTLPDESSS